MIIKSKLKDYEVIFSNNFDFMKEVKETPNKLLIIDKNVYELYKDKLFSEIEDEDIFLIEALETNKNIDSVLKICERMTKIKAKRNATIISFGGGIVQDVTGFAANIMYRGVNWTFIPTTLLAQADSCIGSKTSLNYISYKNLLGTFFPPDKIYIDLQFVYTLTNRDFNSGVGEIVKFNTMNGESNYSELKGSIDKLLERDLKTLEYFVEKSLKFKQTLIEEDEFDHGNRLLLNYGHTFGHAVESITDYEVPHGQAIVIGMLIANKISKNRNLISEKQVKDIEELCLRVLNVKVDEKCFNLEKVSPAIKNDKKRLGNGLSAILLDGDYQLRRVHDIEISELEAALKEAADIFADEHKHKHEYTDKQENKT